MRDLEDISSELGVDDLAKLLREAADKHNCFWLEQKYPHLNQKLEELLNQSAGMIGMISIWEFEKILDQVFLYRSEEEKLSVILAFVKAALNRHNYSLAIRALGSLIGFTSHHYFWIKEVFQQAVATKHFYDACTIAAYVERYVNTLSGLTDTAELKYESLYWQNTEYQVRSMLQREVMEVMTGCDEHQLLQIQQKIRNLISLYRYSPQGFSLIKMYPQDGEYTKEVSEFISTLVRITFFFRDKFSEIPGEESAYFQHIITLYRSVEIAETIEGHAQNIATELGIDREGMNWLVREMKIKGILEA